MFTSYQDQMVKNLRMHDQENEEHMKKEGRHTGVPLAIRAEEALRGAVAKAIAERKMKGKSIAVWRDGRVIQIPSEQIAFREIGAKYSASRPEKADHA